LYWLIIVDGVRKEIGMLVRTTKEIFFNLNDKEEQEKWHKTMLKLNQTQVAYKTVIRDGFGFIYINDEWGEGALWT
jgi:hypothetical protein